MSTIVPNSNPLSFVVIPIRDGIIFPFTENVLSFGRQMSVNAIEEGNKRDKMVVVVMQQNPSKEAPGPHDLYQVGVLARIEKTLTGGKGELNALLRGLQKVKIVNYTKTEPYFEAQVEIIEDEFLANEEIEAMTKHISSQIQKAINLGKAIDLTFLMNVINTTSPLQFSYQVASILDAEQKERQELLEETDLKKRLQKEVDMINHEVKVLELEKNISAKTQRKFDRYARENFLREKMRTIEEELGERDSDIVEYERKIKAAKMPKDVEKKAMKELNKLAAMSQYNPESSYIRGYLDVLVELPWRQKSAETIDIEKSQKILDEDHYGLEKVKERIIEYLSVLKLQRQRGKKTSSPTILTFFGPPGVGKTSIGKSIARALGRKFVKISLGGVRDEAEILGHRRTYVGAMPGRIIQGIRNAGVTNPVFMLDEIDKIGKDYRGDAAAALLEALDPEQNNAFKDNYLEVPYDLSQVVFIGTANMLETIPPALRDRLEIITFTGYTEEEKFHIAKDYIVKKEREAHSLEEKQVAVTDEALRLIINRYTRESGVRELTRQIANIMRKVARKIAEGAKEQIIVDENMTTALLGPYKYSSLMGEEEDTIGMSTGLAWTQVGGEILHIEVALMPGKGSLTLTGQLGDVMKESAQAALTYIKSQSVRLGIDSEIFSKTDVHVHVPEGAVPKDGPSAGSAITTAIASAFTRLPVRKDVGMTGEVTLRGRILEIGGVKEKVIAAHRAGIKTVIIPKDNEKDLVDVPDYVKKDLQFIPVKHVEDVLNFALQTNKERPRVFIDSTPQARLN